MLVKVLRYPARVTNLERHIAQSQALEVHLAAVASYIERNRSVAFAANCSNFMAIIEESANDIRIKEYFRAVPFTRTELCIVWREWQFHSRSRRSNPVVCRGLGRPVGR